VTAKRVIPGGHVHVLPGFTHCRVAKFNGVHSIDMHFTGNFGADATEIAFIGLKGEFNEVRPW
jgi:hypothetical protein